MPESSRVQPGYTPGSIVRQWKKLLPVAGFIIGTISSIGIEPPYSPGSDRASDLVNFARFIVAAFIVLTVMPRIKKKEQLEQAKLWGKVAAIALIASIVAFFVYDNWCSQWTITHRISKEKQKVIVVGPRDELRDDVKEFVANNRDMTDWELLSNAAWSPYKIWKGESIRRRRFILSVMYILFTPLFALTMVAVAQVLNCAGSREPPPRRKGELHVSEHNVGKSSEQH
jgi:hypothetical protein